MMVSSTFHVSLSTEHAASEQLSQDFNTWPQSCVKYLYQCVGPQGSVSLRNGGGGGSDSSEYRFFYPRLESRKKEKAPTVKIDVPFLSVFFRL